MDLEFHVGARVVCADGPAGRLRRVVLDQATDVVTRLVVETKSHFGSLVLVDRHAVAASSRDRLVLGCRLAELRALPEFAEVVFLRPEQPHPLFGYLPTQYLFETLDTLIAPLGAPTLPTPVLEQHLKRGEIVVGRSAPIFAADGLFGHVDEVDADPESGLVARLVVRRGRLLGSHTVAVPGPAVECVQPGAIRLRMASAELEFRFGTGRRADETAAAAVPARDAKPGGDAKVQ